LLYTAQLFQEIINTILPILGITIEINSSAGLLHKTELL